ncbi:MAG: hypothetical protein ABI769_01860 [Pseudomonadota bacterium]
MLTRKSLSMVAGAAIFAAHCPSAFAAPTHCHPYGASGYCQYDGKVSRVYINAYQQVILYFDSTFNTADATAVGIAGVSINNAAVFNTATNPEFAKALFAAMLTAQARGATVSVQMSSSSSGYLLMDRIWVNE